MSFNLHVLYTYVNEDEGMIEESIDPRCRRTRAMLRDGLAELMQTKSFERISVADIADAATLNRATFYDHYTDKFALLDEVVSARFDEQLARRGVAFDGSCECALSATVLAVCDYLASVPWLGSAERPQAQWHLEVAVVAVVRRTLLAGMRRDRNEAGTSPEMIAAAASWAMYGAAKEWLCRPERCESAQIVGAIAALVAPIFAQAAWLHEDAGSLAASALER